ncbi:conserved hypothetical protein [Uncinocarpus reesii 1704]|uniref:UspA domain-containing protein n=1 Tax=Uncinocarpus reesii (strain UAMH 1704) TaxID=336963 RepID=C4JEN5_UNCRE|nr:uncharacterized protein UREG_02195 [Uncinocarpus reesii 1704]EEP77346.1 conserved hypothetical protein [Uncinocarpus reesii 1704]
MHSTDSTSSEVPKSDSGLTSSHKRSSSYNRGVSFDTFDNRDATDFSLTLNYKHKDYHSTRRSRTFLCGTDQNDYSDFALEWLIDELVDDGDEIVCLRVVEKDSKIASDASVEGGRYRKEAEKLFEQVIAKNAHDEKAISLVMELAVGKVQEIIQRMIQIYEPAALIVGTRGRSLGGMQGLLPGSVSKYCLQQSPIPVVVVRPSQKREKKKKKRLADPSRRSYNQIMRLSQAKGDHLFDTTSANSSTSRLPEHEEAAAVAAAIGLPSSSVTDLHEERTSKRSSRDFTSSQTSDAGETESIGQRSTSTAPNPPSPSLDFSSVVLKSPGLPDADSRSVSEGGEDEDFMDDSSRITPISTTASVHSYSDDPMDASTPTPRANVPNSSETEKEHGLEGLMSKPAIEDDVRMHTGSPAETKDTG